jgi:hypothetical protein
VRATIHPTDRSQIIGREIKITEPCGPYDARYTGILADFPFCFTTVVAALDVLALF